MSSGMNYKHPHKRIGWAYESVWAAAGKRWLKRKLHRLARHRAKQRLNKEAQIM